MAGRQDALRNFYRRRQIEKKKKEQPLIIDDNAASDDDRLSIEAIRNIYIDPEEVDGTAIPLAENQITGEVEAKLSDKAKGGDPSKKCNRRNYEKYPRYGRNAKRRKRRKGRA